MNQETITANLVTTEQILVDPLPNLYQPDGDVQRRCILSKDWRMEDIQLLRSQLIRKNRLLQDLKRQLAGAQNVLNQLHCMADPDVTAALEIHEQTTDNSISFIDCAKGAMQEFDSSADRMSYLVRQLTGDVFSIKF